MFYADIIAVVSCGKRSEISCGRTVLHIVFEEPSYLMASRHHTMLPCQRLKRDHHPGYSNPRERERYWSCSMIFLHIPWYSAKFRHILWYSGIPGFHNGTVLNHEIAKRNTKTAICFCLSYETSKQWIMKKAW